MPGHGSGVEQWKSSNGPPTHVYNRFDGGGEPRLTGEAVRGVGLLLLRLCYSRAWS